MSGMGMEFTDEPDFNATTYGNDTTTVHPDRVTSAITDETSSEEDSGDDNIMGKIHALHYQLEGTRTWWQV